MKNNGGEERDGSIVEGLLELVYPTRCVGCERQGMLLCRACDEGLPRIAQEHACHRCGAPFGGLVCTECFDSHGLVEFGFSQAVCALEFLDTAARLVVGYKDQHERRLAQTLALLIAEALPDEWVGWADALSWIPCDRRALRRRGFDHMRHIALELARITGLEARGLLRKSAVADQRDLGRAGRQENAGSLFSVNGTLGLLPTNLLLIDDVLTTGATLDAAACVLLGAGIGEIRVATVARVW